MKYIVSQTFETLGEPCRREFTSEDEAGDYANKLKDDLAKMVDITPVPKERYLRKSGPRREMDVWDKAEEIADIHWDEEGYRWYDSPFCYGMDAGRFIAEQAVEIKEEED